MSQPREQIRSFIAKFVREHDLQDEDDIFALGLVDSMFAMQMVLFVEQAFGIEVVQDDLDLDNFRSIGALSRFVTRKRGLVRR